MNHRFRPGQTVRVRRGLPNRSAAEGDYKVIRPLPESGGGELEYRVKSAREAYERVVKESDIETP
jgi:hypothetical protein